VNHGHGYENSITGKEVLSFFAEFLRLLLRLNKHSSFEVNNLILNSNLATTKTHRQTLPLVPTMIDASFFL